MALSTPFVRQVVDAGKQVSKHSTPVYLLARVTHVVNGPFFQGTQFPDPNYKDPSDIGSVLYMLVNTTQDRTLQAAGNPPAKPINSAIKQYPAEGEFILLFQGPSVDLNVSRDSRNYYYTLPFNLWNASHHNAFPDMGDYSSFVNNTKKTYQQTLVAQQPNNLSVTSSVNYPLGPNFPEKSTIKALRPFAGDLTLEGRWGNSIRFGSTSAIDKQANYWSSEPSPAGSPITIIRNGQGKQSDDIAWFPTVENINVDPSSIYLTEGQVIVIDDIDRNFSLASLGVNIQDTITVSIPIQQQLTSIDTLSPLEQDQRINSIS
jgi:hypothetical protein